MGNLPLPPGTVFAGRFVLDKLAGKGGMGTVYRARDQLSGEWVALKLLSDAGAEGWDGERFAREAQILSELSHPHIVGYVAHGLTAQGQRYLAMQWLDGEDLAQRIARGPMSLADALAMTRRVAEALEFSHRLGIIHRDLKPQNLFLPEGDFARVKLLDFGVARHLTTSMGMTRTGMIVGTPEYMSPEQARGARKLTPAADIFSLGCVLYECLTGEPAFAAEHVAAALVRILFEEPKPVALRRPELPAAVGELLARMLVKDAEQRTQSAGEVVEAIAALGELSSLPTLPMLPATLDARAAAKPESEQVLMSLVLASLAAAPAGSDATVAAVEAAREVDQYGVLFAELRELGAKVERLAGGELVVLAPQLASARDQVSLAARCATSIKQHWSEANVVVVTGRGARRLGGVGGEALNRGWRLLSRPMNSPLALRRIHIDEVSAGLLESRFEIERLEAQEEGFALGDARPDADSGRLLLGKPTPCVGRDRELITLEAVYNECKAELLARAVLVLGMPGMGKSRLRHEFLRRLESRGEQLVVLMGRGDLMKTKSSYGLLGEALRQQLGLHDGQPLAEQRARLHERIGARIAPPEAQRVIEFFGELCGVPFPDEASAQLRAARQNPLLMGDQLERAWLDGLRSLQAEAPLLLILEDLHWGDALTVRLVGAALRQLREQAFMVLALARPEVEEQYPNLWAGMVQSVPLQPLSSKSSERLVRQILGSNVTSEATARIIEQSTGNPLFLEELIRAAATHKTGELPGTIVAMIQARIGRLSAETRRVLLAASVFGETFWASGVKSLLDASLQEWSLESSLKDLIQQEIVEESRERRFVEQKEYRFRHALMREAAYALAGESELLVWHRHAAAFLEACGEHDPAVIAEHYHRGGERQRAATLFSQAAVQLFDRHDQQRSIVYAERAEACGIAGSEGAILLALKATVACWQDDFATCIETAPAALGRLQVGGYWWCRTVGAVLLAAVHTGDAARVAQCGAALLQAHPEPVARAGYFQALAHCANFGCYVGQVAQAAEFHRRFEQLQAEVESDASSRGWRDCVWAYYFLLLGDDPWQAAMAAQRGIAAFQEGGEGRDVISVQALFGMALAALGDPDAAERHLRDGLKRAEEVGHSYVIAYARSHRALVLSGLGRPSWHGEAAAIARSFLAQPSFNILYGALAHATLARIAAAEADWSRTLHEAEQARRVLRLFPVWGYLCAPVHIRALLNLQRPSEARQLADEVMGCVVQTQGAGMNELAVRLAHVEALMADGATAEAHAALRTAVTLLRERAQRIPESASRERYLTQVPENASLLSLARAWKLESEAR